MAEWSRVVNTTTHEFLKKEEVNVLRNRVLTAMMKEKGRISYNHGGDLMDWKVRYRQAAIAAYGDAQPITFARQDRWKTAQLDWRGYVTSDMMTKREKLANKGAQAIIKVYDEIANLLMEEMREQFSTELYVDGNAAGNSNRIHGIESFMANSGASTVMPIATPSDTFAGLNTDLANYGGSWTGNWPDGTGDAVYDFWSPLIVNYTSTITTDATHVGWTAATKTWANTCTEALRFGILYTQKNRTLDGALDFALLDGSLYRIFLDSVDTNERILVQRGQDSKLVKLGFGDTIFQDGLEITWEYGVPANVGYGFNVDKMELRCMDAQLFDATGPIYDENTNAWRFLLDFNGNCTWNPRHFVAWKAVG